MTRQELENLRDLRDLIIDSITEVSRLLESYHQGLFEEWKSSGKLISDEIPGLNLTEVLDRLEETVVEQDQEVQEDEEESSALAAVKRMGRFSQR